MAEKKSFDELVFLSPKELGGILLGEIDTATVDMEYVHDLIAAGASLEAQTRYNGLTPLHIATGRDNTEITKLLISFGVNLNSMDDWGLAPLHGVAEQGCFKSAILLIQAGALINIKTENNYLSWTPLHYAACNGECHMVTLFLAAGADVNALDSDNWTPLHYAAFNEYVDICYELINSGASLTIKTSEGKTPWDYANAETKEYVPQLNPNYNG